MKDSLDGAFDVSDYLIYAHGFIPIPYIITEPAVGGFGGALIPVFIQKNPPYIDTINGKQKITPVPPDITGAGAMYTANNSWLLGAFRSGTFLKPRIKYRILGGYGNINLSYYRTVANLGEKEFKFHLKVLPFSIQTLKNIRSTKLYVGANYTFRKTTISYDGQLPEFVQDKEVSSIISKLNIVGEWDNRDNVFTPNNGFKVHIDAGMSDNILGSDFDYFDLNYYGIGYKQLLQNLVLGLRIQGTQIYNKAPFYMVPSIQMRGVPAARFQGNTTLVGETEVRWDFVKRWSAVLFGGTGKAFDDWSYFSDAKWVTSGGAGFRYLMARKFDLRAGIDVARGPDTWAYYIVFGSNWLR